MAVHRRNVRRFLVAGALLVALVVFLGRYRDEPLFLPSKSSRPGIRFRKSTFDWSKAKQHYPVSSVTHLPKGRPLRLPSVQVPIAHEPADSPSHARRKAVRDVFLRSYNAYSKFAWMRDELAPVAGTGKDTFGGWAATMVDALDTMWLMGLHDEFYNAVASVVQIDWANTTLTGINVFETTIRHLGGLLSAHDLSGEPSLLRKAKELGDMLYMAFDTPNRLPNFWLVFDNALKGTQLAGLGDPSAAPCSLALEFTRLAQLTGEHKYYDAVDRIAKFLERTQGETRLPGMWPMTIDFRNELVDNTSGFTLGALADSLYEYLPKMHMLLGGLDPKFEKMYRNFIAVVTKHMLFRPMTPEYEDVLFVGDVSLASGKPELVAESQHLTCFVGGMFGLGGKLFGLKDHVEIGEKLARGCAWAYDSFESGIMPEIFNLIPCPQYNESCPWDLDLWEQVGDKKLEKGFKNARDPRYLLRPEAIESIFLLYRMTGKRDLQEIAWRMFKDITKATETEFAYSAIADVTVPGEMRKLDSMESFWLSETLKYFYLIFSPPDLVHLDDYVFNTEAHPFKRPK